ncbi:2-amino-4-hydroxy-6-hydroxymethyldihydropteridine diphosphokinase [candidate division KSB1 bacterium]|nr:2-amino-4-hydroxy-6-hydroxymethyldihydropteridine diphosphokinase [candidate division KSB1 bacterium]
MTVEHAYIGYGANLGDRVGTLQRASAELRQGGVEILRVSSLYATEPWGGARGGAYINAVLEVRRGESPEALLKLMLQVETMLGRKRSIGGAARTCDLDLLLWGDVTMYTDDLIVPHPRLTQRRFVLDPLCELLPDAVHPKFGCAIWELREACQDTSKVELFRE